MSCPHGANCAFCRALDELKAESEAEADNLRRMISVLETQLAIFEKRAA